MPERELATLLGHTYAVRRVLFSPHTETLVASCRCGASPPPPPASSARLPARGRARPRAACKQGRTLSPARCAVSLPAASLSLPGLHPDVLDCHPGILTGRCMRGQLRAALAQEQLRAGACRAPPAAPAATHASCALALAGAAPPCGAHSPPPPPPPHHPHHHTTPRRTCPAATT